MPPNARTDTEAAPNPDPDPATPRDRYDFPVTQWSVVAKAVAKDTPEGQQALTAICERYWLPLYAFARRSGCTPPDAEDMTQDFIYAILRRNGLKSANSEKGRLRSFLMSGLKNHMISVHRKESTQTRGVDKLVRNIPIAEAEQLLAEDENAYAGSADSPAQVFERRWALALLDRVLSRLEQDFEQKGEAELFKELRPFLSGKDRNGDKAYSQVGVRLGISENLVGVRIHRLKKQYREILREEISATVEPSEVESEIQHTFRTCLDDFAD